MPFNISAFKANGLVYGGARPSQFQVFMSVPASLGVDNVSVEKFRWVCKGAELPASTVGKIPVPYFGRTINEAGDRVFSDWSVSVMNDEDFAVRGLFEAWSNAINRLESNVRDPALGAGQYKVDLEVLQYSKDGGVIRSYQMIGAYPTDVGAISLGWDQRDAIEEFSVTFAYDYWLPLVESSDKKAGGVNVYGPQASLDGASGPN